MNNRDKNFTKEKMKRRLAEVEASIDRYIEQLVSMEKRAEKARAPFSDICMD